MTNSKITSELKPLSLTIERGEHWFKPIRPRRFREEYVYVLKSAPMVHSAFINKAVGISESINPHKNSIRVGWRRDKDLVIHWYYYIYHNRERRFIELENFKGKEEITVRFKYDITIPDYDKMNNPNNSLLRGTDHGIQSSNAVYITKKVPTIGVHIEADDITDAHSLWFIPKWMTHFFWGGSTPFPNSKDSFWIETNVDYSDIIGSYYAAWMSISPLTASVIPLLAIFLIDVAIAQFSSTLAVLFIILVLAIFLGYILRNKFNYERWFLYLKSLGRRTRSFIRKLRKKKSTTSK